MPKIYTKNGDSGNTNLFLGGSLSKSDLRVETYGTVDEAVSCLGFAKTQINTNEIKEIIEHIQHSLFKVGAELSTQVSKSSKINDLINTINESSIKELEKFIDEATNEVNIGTEFIMPGISSGSASLDVARTVVRRLERLIVNLNEKFPLKNHNIMIYINRMSDLLFVLGRLEDKNRDTKKIRGIRK
tara:strand:- start:655 stop:1215 length:561 start_codon:yes stop_codon:yes gene_type:complete